MTEAVILTLKSQVEALIRYLVKKDGLEPKHCTHRYTYYFEYQSTDVGTKGIRCCMMCGGRYV